MHKARMLGLPALFLLACVAHADTTIRIRSTTTFEGQEPSTHHKTYYRRGAMRRRESSEIVDIANCDTKTGFLIDLNAHEYRTYNVVRFWSPAQFDEYLRKDPGSAVRVEIKTLDTGERKTFFGQTAKHFITTIKRPADTDDAGGEETIDGWYVDHERPDHSCAPQYTRENFLFLVGTLLVTYPQVPQFTYVGPVPDGLAVKQTRTVRFAPTKGKPSGQTITGEETVEELSDAPLNPSLFQLPPGLRENPKLLSGHSITPQ
jgi:hypothetical protein